MSFFLQIPLQIAEVIDLAVQHDPDRAGLVREGLMSSVNVNDAQSPKAKSYVTIRVKPGIVWPSMGESIAHGAEEVAVHRPRTNNSYESAHCLFNPLSCP
jgi:hypothetical protein